MCLEQKCLRVTQSLLLYYLEMTIKFQLTRVLVGAQHQVGHGGVESSELILELLVGSVLADGHRLVAHVVDYLLQLGQGDPVLVHGVLDQSVARRALCN